MTTDQLLENVDFAARAKGLRVSGRTLERTLDGVIRQLTVEIDPWRRHQIVAPVAGTGEYALASDAHRVLDVWYDGGPLTRASEQEVAQENSLWRTGAGTPLKYIQFGNRLRVSYVPTASGTALTWTGAASITATAGHTIAGHDYYLGDDSGERFFRPADGSCMNPEATGNLLVRMSFAPAACEFDTVIPPKFEHALEALTKAAILGDDAMALRTAEIAKNAIRPDVAPKRRSLSGEAYW